MTKKKAEKKPADPKPAEPVQKMTPLRKTLWDKRKLLEEK